MSVNFQESRLWIFSLCWLTESIFLDQDDNHFLVWTDAAAGGSDDWAKGVAGIKYSYTVELRDSGWHGFVVPADEIDDSGEEMWAGIKEMQNAILEQSSRK